MNIYGSLVRMGWRQEARSEAAAARREANERKREARHDAAEARRREKEREKVERQVERQTAREQARAERLHNEQIDRFLRDADALDKRIAADPIDALALRYVEGRGVVSTLPAGYEADAASKLLPERQPAPPAVLHQSAACRLTMLDMRVAPFGVVVALLVEASERLRLDFIRKTDPKKSLIFIVDRASGSYLYPSTTTLPSVLVSGMPTIGLVLFDPVPSPVTALEIHAVDLRLGDESVTIAHTYSPHWLAHESGVALAAPSVRQHAEAHLREQEERRRAEEEARVRASARMWRTAALVIGAIILGSCTIGLCGSVAMDCARSTPTPTAKPPPPAKTPSPPKSRK